MRARAPGPLGDNQPYGIELDGGDVTVLVHGDDRGVPTIAFEVRHDELADDAAVAAWCDRIGQALEQMLATRAEADAAAAL